MSIIDTVTHLLKEEYTSLLSDIAILKSVLYRVVREGETAILEDFLNFPPKIFIPEGRSTDAKTFLNNLIQDKKLLKGNEGNSLDGDFNLT